MVKKIKLLNKKNEKLDAWIEEGIDKSKDTVVMVHGFATDKHETAGYFGKIQ